MARVDLGNQPSTRELRRIGDTTPQLRQSHDHQIGRRSLSESRGVRRHGSGAGLGRPVRTQQLRHGVTRRVFDRVEAPSTFSTFLRRFRFGHVRHLNSAARLAHLATSSPVWPPRRQPLSPSTTPWSAPTATPKQGRRRRFTEGPRAGGTNSTACAEPGIAGTRLRSSARTRCPDQHQLLTHTRATARPCRRSPLMPTRGQLGVPRPQHHSYLPPPRCLSPSPLDIAHSLRSNHSRPRTTTIKPTFRGTNPHYPDRLGARPLRISDRHMQHGTRRPG